MELVIKKLDQRLRIYPWQSRVSYLDRLPLQYSRDVLIYVTRKLGSLDPSRRSEGDQLLLLLQSHMLFFFLSLDRAGLTAILRKIVKDLPSFSFQELDSFRRFEEGLLGPLEMPRYAWDKFWKTLDVNKLAVFSQMRQADKFTMRKYVIPGIISGAPSALNDIHEMSPFSWSRALAAGASTALGIVDGLESVPTLGVAALSFLGSVVGAMYLAGTEEGNEPTRT